LTAPLSSFVEVHPTTANVLAGGSMAINVKFLPQRDILHKLAHYSAPHKDFQDSARLMIPVQIDIEGQELPIFFVIKTDVTSSNLHLSTQTLDFGKVYVSQQSTKQVTVKNSCMLPQKFAFVNMKKEIRIQPNDGFAVLLPNESITFDVSLCPASALSYNYALTALTSSNDNYDIKIRAQGEESPVVIENPVVYLLPTTPGEKVLDNVFLLNSSRSRQCVEVVVPDARFTWLKISPSVVELRAGERCRLEVEYCPPRDMADYQPHEWHRKLAESTGGQSPFGSFAEEDGWVSAHGAFGGFQWTKPDSSTEECEAGVSLDEWGYVGRFHIPIFLKPQTMGAITNENKEALMKLLSPPLYLNIETVISKPEFIADTQSIDFGQMAVGTSQIKTIKVRNLGYSRTITLKTSGLNAVGPFSVVNAAREMPPSQWHTILVECSPCSQGLFVESLELESRDGGPHIFIALRVQGVNPALEILGLTPHPDWSIAGGILNFGDVTSQVEQVKKFSIRNKSLFTIEASIERAVFHGVPVSQQSELLQRTVAGLPIFSCRPECAIIPQGETVDVEVVFRPDRARLFPYREDFSVVVGKGETPIRVCALGRCHQRQLFVRTVDPFDEPFFRETLKDERDEDVLLTHSSQVVRSQASESAVVLGVGSTPQHIIKLDFPDPYASSGVGVDEKEGNKSQSCSFAVCCASMAGGLQEAPPPAGAATGKGAKGAGVAVGKTVGSDASFEFKFSENAIKSKYFTVSVDRGSVPAGGEVVVTVVCTLIKPKGLGGLEVGNWQTFESSLILRGGWRPEGDDSNEVTLPILLNAYVRL